jgi:DNA-binding NarL/FixJ family response regulator
MSPSSHLSLSSYRSANAPRITVIDGSQGLRLLLRAFISSRWSNADVVEIDPFSQTMHGIAGAVSMSAGTVLSNPPLETNKASVIILGGVGTLIEARSALNRLTSQRGCPPIIVLVAADLFAHRDELIANGAFNILRKDAISFGRMADSITAALNGEAVPVEKTTRTYGQFSFVQDGNRHILDIDGYRYLSNLSSGVRSQVFFAEHIDSGRRAVIKVQTSSPLQNVEMLNVICERALAINLSATPHLVKSIDTGLTGVFPYIAIEYLPHGDLRQHTKAPLDVSTKLSIVVRLLDALGAMHRTGYVHADLKPESIFFRADGSVVLIDFNISTKFGHAVSASETGDVFGTPTYMSAEQGAGTAVNAASDLYSVGVILFELLAGIPPFSGATPAQTIFRHIHDEIPLLPLKLRQFQPIVDIMLAKHPAERYQSAEEAKMALQECIAANRSTV